MNRPPLLLHVLPFLLFASTASAQETLKVQFNTTPADGLVAPKNVVAVWVEDATGSFIKTIGRWSGERTNFLLAWLDASGGDTDAVSGATRLTHDDRLTVTWDLTDRDGQPVPEGLYTIRMELSDSHPETYEENNQGTFSFALDHALREESIEGNGFEDVTITYTKLEPGATAEPMGAMDESPNSPQDTGPPAIVGGCQTSGSQGALPHVVVVLLLLVYWAVRKSRQSEV